jgi:hypothetical protein
MKLDRHGQEKLNRIEFHATIFVTHLISLHHHRFVSRPPSQPLALSLRHAKNGFEATQEGGR